MGTDHSAGIRGHVLLVNPNSNTRTTDLMTGMWVAYLGLPAYFCSSLSSSTMVIAEYLLRSFHLESAPRLGRKVAFCLSSRFAAFSSRFAAFLCLRGDSAVGSSPSLPAFLAARRCFLALPICGHLLELNKLRTTKHYLINIHKCKHYFTN